MDDRDDYPLLELRDGGSRRRILAGALTGRLLSTLLVVATLATVFEQFPIGANVVVVASWFLAASGGVAAGAWIGSAKRADRTLHECQTERSIRSVAACRDIL